MRVSRECTIQQCIRMTFTIERSTVLSVCVSEHVFVAVTSERSCVLYLSLFLGSYLTEKASVRGVPCSWKEVAIRFLLKFLQ